MDTKTNQKCDFCGTREDESVLIRGLDGVIICSLCVDEATDILKNKRIKDEATSPKPTLTPSIIKNTLDKTVVGQDQAKRLLSIAIYNHHKRINNKTGVEIQKSNVLLVGPSGSGKTHLVKQIAKIAKLPLVIVDASSITKAGFIGDDTEGMLSRLYMESRGDMALAETGIVFIDEGDKLARSDTQDGRKDINGLGVQHELLKIMEGSIVAINPDGTKKNSGSKEVMMDTHNILFIIGGAFDGIINQKNTKTMGIGSKNDNLNTKITHADIIKYGFIPEFVGRIPVIASLSSLSLMDVRKILSEIDGNLVNQYTELLKIDGVDLKFDIKFLDAVAEIAIAHPTGARALRSIMEHSLENIMFIGPDNEKEVLVGADDLKY